MKTISLTPDTCSDVLRPPHLTLSPSSIFLPAHQSKGTTKMQSNEGVRVVWLSYFVKYPTICRSEPRDGVPDTILIGIRYAGLRELWSTLRFVQIRQTVNPSPCKLNISSSIIRKKEGQSIPGRPNDAEGTRSFLKDLRCWCIPSFRSPAPRTQQ